VLKNRALLMTTSGVLDSDQMDQATTIEQTEVWPDPGPEATDASGSPDEAQIGPDAVSDPSADSDDPNDVSAVDCGAERYDDGEVADIAVGPEESSGGDDGGGCASGRHRTDREPWPGSLVGVLVLGLLLVYSLGRQRRTE
jgi:hypothetical protein